MPNYVVMRVADIPSVGQSVSGMIRVENAADEATAVQQALASWRETGITGGVVGVTVASNVNRRTFSSSTSYTVT